MITPVSNVVLERFFFSQVTEEKTKSSNKMSFKMLGLILRVRTALIVSGKCCMVLEITGDMMQRLAVDMYDHARALNAPPKGNDASHD